MLSIFEAVDLTLHDAVRAYVTDDRDLAKKAKEKTFQIDARCANLEAVCYNLIATQSPVASDFRLLQTIIYIDFNLQRMCDKVRRIARAANRKVKSDFEVPAVLVDLIENEAESVYRVMGASVTALVNNDLSLVLSLSDEDEVVHDLYQKFFRTFNRTEAVELDDDAAMDDFRRTIMVSRYLDRIANISMECAYRLVFLLTGQRWTAADLADADEDELEGMRVPSGEGVILDPASDARYVSSLPLDEVGSELKRLIEEDREEA